MFRGSWFNDFDTDPFFSPHCDRFSSFDNFFNHDPFSRALPEPVHNVHPQQHESRETSVEHHQRHDVMAPFGRSMFGNMFSRFDHAFQRMDASMERLQNDPDSHCYSHSSVMTYSRGEDGQPKYFEATNSSRTAPGGLRETKKTVRDSERDLAKMEVGRHIGDRGHVIEKSRNTRTGHQEEKQNFLGIEQDSAAVFNEEWQSKMAQQFRYREALDGHAGRGEARALEDSSSGRKEAENSMKTQEKKK